MLLHKRFSPSQTSVDGSHRFVVGIVKRTRPLEIVVSNNEIAHTIETKELPAFRLSRLAMAANLISAKQFPPVSTDAVAMWLYETITSTIEKANYSSLSDGITNARIHSDTDSRLSAGASTARAAERASRLQQYVGRTPLATLPLIVQYLPYTKLLYLKIKRFVHNASWSKADVVKCDVLPCITTMGIV